MALHSTPSSMLKESLIESLKVAEFCVNYRKVTDYWGGFATGGCLGFPGGVIMFSIVDSIGSYLRDNKELGIKIDNEETNIKKKGEQHFYILNSHYFDQQLSMKFIQVLYRKFRSFLTHNSVLGKDATMIAGPNKYGLSFFLNEDNTGKTEYIISMVEFYALCEKAVAKFMKDIDNVVPSSRQGKRFN